MDTGAGRVRERLLGPSESDLPAVGAGDTAVSKPTLRKRTVDLVIVPSELPPPSGSADRVQPLPVMVSEVPSEDSQAHSLVGHSRAEGG